MSPIYKSYIQQEADGANTLIGSMNGKETSWSGFFYETDTYLFATVDDKIYSPGKINFTTYQMNGFNRLTTSRFESLSTGFFYVSFGFETNTNISGSVAMLGNKFQVICYENPLTIRVSLSKMYILNSTSSLPAFELDSTFENLHSSKLHETYMSV